MRVLSTSKNAPADGSGVGGGCSTSAAAADAAPAAAAPLRPGQRAAAQRLRGPARQDRPASQHPHTGTHATRLTWRGWLAGKAPHRWSGIRVLTRAEVVTYLGMSISLAVAAIGALAALVFTGLLARRCLRVPRLATVALLFAAAALAVALVAQASGYYHGFGETTFRSVQLGAQLIAPLAFTWALAELTGKSMGARFASRLALAALTVVGAVVLATDPLGSAAFSKSWPTASVHYQIIPNGMLKFVAAVTALAAVVAVIVTGIRARHSAGWRMLFLAVAAIAVGSVLTD